MDRIDRQDNRASLQVSPARDHRRVLLLPAMINPKPFVSSGPAAEEAEP